MGLIRRHPYISAGLAFLLISLPSGVAAWLSLWEMTGTGGLGNIDRTGYLTAKTWLEMVPVLGIVLFLMVLWQIRKGRKGESDNDSEEPTIGLQRPPGPESADVLNHSVADVRNQSDLNIQGNQAGETLMNPIPRENTQPSAVEVLDYSIEILWNDVPIQQVRWTEGERTASINISLSASHSLEEDPTREFLTPGNPSQIAHSPDSSSPWAIRGGISFEHANQTRRVEFEIDADHYQLSDTALSNWHINRGPPLS